MVKLADRLVSDIYLLFSELEVVVQLIYEPVHWADNISVPTAIVWRQ
jgi:hypothetical protein